MTNLRKIAILSLISLGFIPGKAQAQQEDTYETFTAPVDKVFVTVIRSIATHFYIRDVIKEAGLVVFYTEDPRRTYDNRVNLHWTIYTVVCDERNGQTTVTLALGPDSVDVRDPDYVPKHLWHDLQIYTKVKSSYGGVIGEKILDRPPSIPGVD